MDWLRGALEAIYRNSGIVAIVALIAVFLLAAWLFGLDAIVDLVRGLAG